MGYYEDYEVRLGGVPDRDELAEITLRVAEWLRKDVDRADLIDIDDPLVDENPEEANAGTECRIQLIGGNYYWYDGDPQYDSDSRGYWGCGWVPYELTDREEALSIADDLISDLEEHAGGSGAFERLILGYTYDETELPSGATATDEEIRVVHHILEFSGGLDDAAYTAACGCVVDGVEEAPKDASVAGHVTCPDCLAQWDTARQEYNLRVAVAECKKAPDSARPLFVALLLGLDRLENNELDADEVREYIQRLIDIRLCYRLRPRTSLSFLEDAVNKHIESGAVEATYGAALEE